MKKGANQSVGWLGPMELEKVTFGVRYEPQHQILDHVGEVIDEVLRAKGTPFGPSTFPLVNSLPTERRLFHLESDALLRITTSDTILSLPLTSKRAGDISETAADFDGFVLERLRKIAKLQNIIRYGVVLNLTGTSASLNRPPIERYLSSEFSFPGHANSLQMRFTRRLAADEALVRKGVEDYRNVIYTVREEDGKVDIGIDYQHYFDPFLSSEDWNKHPFTNFVSQALSYFQGEFHRWLEKSVGVAEVA